MRRVDTLRLMLPRARDLESSPLRCAWRSGADAWEAELLDGLPAVARRFQPRHVEACLHPADVSMAQVELPPLAIRRQRIAVLGAVELLALGPASDLAVGFGARNDEGQVPVAWMSARALSALVQVLKAHGVDVDAVLPPPAFLPGPEDGPDGAVAATVVDDWAVARTGAGEGIACPIPQGRIDAAQIEARLKPLLPEGRLLRLLAADTPVEDAQSMGGSGWSWSLPVGHAAQAGHRRPWLLPLAGWTVAALAVWLVGLNLYASRIAAQGQMLTRQMAAQVKAAYPEVPVILNPLQQARQLRDARRAGAATGSTEAGSFAALMRASTGLLTQAQGQVQRLEFRDDRLELRWRDGAAPSADELKSLQDRALQHGLAVSAEPGGLRIEAGAVEKGAGPTPRAASAAGATR
jgi:general secretion pathway protein L